MSPILEEFRDSAYLNGHEYVLFHAMCVLGIEVYQIEHEQTGQRRLVNQADYAVMVDGHAADGGLIGRMLKRGRSSSPEVASATVTVATEADQGQWKLIKKIHDGTTLLTMNQTRAIESGLAKQTVRDVAELKQYLGAAQVAAYPPSNVAMVAYWLTRPWVRALLMIVLLVGSYLELQAPGIGVGGAMAVVALTILLVAPFLVGLAQIWHVLLFFLGLTLLLAELFVIPGFGLFGVSGIVCMFAGLILMVVPTTGQGWLPMPAPEMAQRLRESVLYTFLSIVVSCVGFYYLTKYFGTIPVLNRLILQTPPAPSVATGNTVDTPSAVVDAGGVTVRVGSVGRAVTGLRPSGRVEFEDQILDVVSVGQWIETGQRVRVVEIHGNRVVVDVHETV